ncbi:cupin domain-containing protein [Limibaculum sp. FT325]|uniref:cupin domain-containing protein n=1 Tax=Thermohalobaculum sediminis TaxID=2939436 RepID=UPI0020C027AD|nr:cupin domain-containing protein [Limibaculum sediminis]MCL5777799.1 cupin domain-containing protein [Limibaculum sediminis]
MSDVTKPDCRVIRPDANYAGRQGLTYLAGISAESAGSAGLCMHLLTMPPGARAKAHLHEAHETAIYMLSGETEMYYGDGLARHIVLREGEMLYIPAGVPHLPMNRTDRPATAVIARTDPNEQESVVLLPHLDGKIP